MEEKLNHFCLACFSTKEEAEKQVKRIRETTKDMVLIFEGTRMQEIFDDDMKIIGIQKSEW